MILKYARIERGGKLPPEPFYATDGAAGLDLTLFGDDLIIPASGHAVAPTGLRVAVPEGHVGLIFVRSSLGVKRGITLSNSAGVIDSDYRGELLVSLHNTSAQPQLIKSGDRIAQLAVIPCPRPGIEESDDLGETDRGAGRFGSTGK